MFEIDIWGREGCGICKRFIERVEKMGFAYYKHDIDKYIVLHDNWRDDHSVEILASMHLHGNSYPPVVAINKEFMTFAGAINLLKDAKNGKVK